LLHPENVFFGRPNKPELPDLERLEIEGDEISGGIDFGKVHENHIMRISPVSLMPAQSSPHP
jgi:hypothetical protein